MLGDTHKKKNKRKTISQTQQKHYLVRSWVIPLGRATNYAQWETLTIYTCLIKAKRFPADSAQFVPSSPTFGFVVGQFCPKLPIFPRIVPTEQCPSSAYGRPYKAVNEFLHNYLKGMAEQACDKAWQRKRVITM